MSSKTVPDETKLSGQYSGGGVQQPINVTQATWHAQIAGGSAVNVTTAFTDPDSTYVTRIPELALSATGTPGAYVITGTYDGAAQTETVTTVANDTVKGDLPFDTITSLVGPDPGGGETLDIYAGDSYIDPPCRAIWTDDGGDLDVALVGEGRGSSNVQTVDSLPEYIDWMRRAVRTGHDNTTITKPWAVW